MDDDVSGRVLQFVQQQNRPLNAQNVADALQKYGFKKTAVQKALDNFASKGLISFKDYGKQRIFMSKQDKLEIPSPEEMESLKARNEQLQEAIMETRERCNSLEKGLKGLESTLTKEQLKDQIMKLTQEKAEMEIKLERLRTGTVQISKEDRRKLEEKCEQLISLWRKRKRIFNDFWEAVTGNFPRDPKVFQEELGIETDEEAGCHIRDFENLPLKKQKNI